LDPAYAIVVESTELPPKERGDDAQVVGRFVTSLDAKGKDGTSRLGSDAKRVGLGMFIRNDPRKNVQVEEEEEEEEEEDEDKPLRKWDEAVDGKFASENLFTVTGDDSWGPVRKDDVRVSVRLF